MALLKPRYSCFNMERIMSNNSITPIFVVGYMHSGTTLLLDILSRHTSVFASKGETKFYEFLPIVRDTFPDLKNEKTLQEFLSFAVNNIISGSQIVIKPLHAQDVDTSGEDMNILLQRTHSMVEHGAIFPLVFGYLAEKAGKSFWLEKTPTHIFSIDLILDYIPSANFIEIVRDPRAILASKKVRRASVWTDRYPAELRPFKNFEKAYDPFWDTLSRKSAINAGILAQKNHPAKVLKIRYEDLVKHQEDTVLKVCEFLSLRFEPGMLNVETKNTAYIMEKAFTGISDKFINRWQEVLIPGEINFPQMLSGKEMQANSYTSIPTPLSSKLISIGILLGSFREFFVRLYKRYRLGGRQYVLNVIRSYFQRFSQLYKRSG